MPETLTIPAAPQPDQIAVIDDRSGDAARRIDASAVPRTGSGKIPRREPRRPFWSGSANVGAGS